MTLDPITSTVETVRFHDACDLSGSNIYTIFPGAKYATRRVRAARALLCTPHTIIDATTNSPLSNPPTQQLVELLLRNLPFREIVQHASRDYALQANEMAWVREKGIRKLGEFLGKDVEALFPDIVSDWVETRKRAWMSIPEEGDRSPGAKRRRMEDEDEDEDEEISEESSGDEEDEDYRDESYLEESSRRTSSRQRKVSIKSESSEPASIETQTPPQPTVKFEPTSHLKELTTNLDGATPLLSMANNQIHSPAFSVSVANEKP